MSVRRKIVVASLLGLVLIAGSAFFWGRDSLEQACTPVPDADQKHYAVAMSLYTRANAAATASNFSVANDLLDLAIVEFWVVPVEGGADDTGMLLAAAQAAAAKAEFQMAVQMKKSVLDTRLSAFRHKRQLAGRCQSVVKQLGLGA